MWVSQPGPSQGLYYGGGPDRGPGGMGGPRFSAPPPPLPNSSARELISVPVNNGNHIGVRTDVIYLLYVDDILVHLYLYAKNYEPYNQYTSREKGIRCLPLSCREIYWISRSTVW